MQTRSRGDLGGHHPTDDDDDDGATHCAEDGGF
jgi:hypothetical protein